MSHDLTRALRAIHHGTPEWHDARRTAIGASEVAAILGRDPWTTPLDVYARKVGDPRAEKPRLALDLGNAMEPLILRRYAERTGHRVSAHQRMLRDRAAPHLSATPDAVYGMENGAPDYQEGILETKLTWQPPGDDDPPIRWQLQVQAQLACSDERHGRIAVLHLVPSLDPDQALRIHDVPRHEDAIGVIREAVERFWRDHVEPRRPPSAGAPGTPIPMRILQALHPLDNGETVELDDAAGTADARLIEIAETMKMLERERDELRARIADDIGDATFGRLPNGGRWSWKHQKRAAYQVAASEGRVLRRLAK